MGTVRCVGVWWGREGVVVYSGEGGMCVGMWWGKEGYV